MRCHHSGRPRVSRRSIKLDPGFQKANQDNGLGDIAAPGKSARSHRLLSSSRGLRDPSANHRHGCHKQRYLPAPFNHTTTSTTRDVNCGQIPERPLNQTRATENLHTSSTNIVATTQVAPTQHRECERYSGSDTNKSKRHRSRSTSLRRCRRKYILAHPLAASRTPPHNAAHIITPVLTIPTTIPAIMAVHLKSRNRHHHRLTRRRAQNRHAPLVQWRSLHPVIVKTVIAPPRPLTVTGRS